MKKTGRKRSSNLRDIFKRLTGEITTDKRFFCIVVVLLVLTIANVAYTVRCIYRIGRKDAERELIHIQHMSKPPVQPDNPHSFTYSEGSTSETETDSLENHNNEIKPYE